MGELADRIQALFAESGGEGANADWPRLHLDVATLADRVAELEQWQDEQLANALRNPRGLDLTVDGLLEAQRRLSGDNPTLSDRLAAAEKRAEQAEYIAAVAQLPEMLGRRAVLSYSPINNDGITRAGFRFVADHRDDGLHVEVENYGKRDRRLSVCVFEADEPSVDLLERRGLELIEAGERLLAEYKRQQEMARKQQEASNG